MHPSGWLLVTSLLSGEVYRHPNFRLAVVRHQEYLVELTPDELLQMQKEITLPCQQGDSVHMIPIINKTLPRTRRV